MGEDTTLAQIIQMVSDAAATKAPIAKIADTVSGFFVPAVITIAVLTTIVWLLLGHELGYALARGISVLVISCPCALGLATPVAIMVGNGLGAKNGILFKTAASLEAAGRTQIVALDKTGTITSGEPKVTDILPAEGVTRERAADPGRLAGSRRASTRWPRPCWPTPRSETIACPDVTELSGPARQRPFRQAGRHGDLSAATRASLPTKVDACPRRCRAQADALSDAGQNAPVLWRSGQAAGRHRRG